jgi:3-hydroxymyristoyl/3-hydroxydecanoyl-(acyl carrier protein) dehydratase
VRFLLFDRITRLEPGRIVEGIKTVSLSEACFDKHFERQALMPASLICEAMVQITAWCAITAHDYALSCVLSMLDDVHLPSDLGPGTTLHLTGKLEGTNPKGSFATAFAEVDGKRVASIGRILYAHVPVPDPALLRERLRYFGGAP